MDSIAPKVAPIFEKACQLAPELVTDDAKYVSHIVEPAWLVVGGMTGGMTSLIPNLHERFVVAFLHARAELLVIDAPAKRISLVEGARDRLPQVLLEGIRKPDSVKSRPLARKPRRRRSVVVSAT